MDSYLIRIYRRSEEEPGKIVGIIEDIQSGMQRSFNDITELCNAITASKPKGSTKGEEEVSHDTD